MNNKHKSIEEESNEDFLKRWKDVEGVELPNSWSYNEQSFRMENEVEVMGEDDTLIRKMKVALVPHDIKDYIFNLPHLNSRNLLERDKAIDEVISVIEGYFKGLVVIPDPQATMKSLVGYIYALKENGMSLDEFIESEGKGKL